MSLESHFSNIRGAIATNDLLQAAKQARAGLESYPKEAELARIEIVAFIKLERTAQALDAISRARQAKLLSAKELAYEIAYCNFLRGNYTDTEKALQGAALPGPVVDRLLAQVAYKKGDYPKCVDLYEKLLADADGAAPEREELLVNLAAAKAAAAQIDGRDMAGNSDSASKDSYELMFNASTEMLARGKARDAATLLTAAEARAKADLAEDGWSGQDVQGELGPIEAQKAVALQVQGKLSKARAIYARLLKCGSLDQTTRATVCHNMAVMDSQDGAAAAAKIKRAIQIPGGRSVGLTRYQQALMTYNMAALHFLQGHYKAARRLLLRMGKEYSDCSVAGAGLLSAAVSLKHCDMSKALNELLALVHTGEPVQGASAAIAAAQIAMRLGDPEKAKGTLCEWRDKAKNVTLGSLAEPGTFARYYFGTSQLAGWLSQEPAANTATEAAAHLYSAAYGQDHVPSASLLAAVGDCMVYAGDLTKARKCFTDAKEAAAGDRAQEGPLETRFMAAVLASADDTHIPSTAELLRGYSRREQIARSIPGIPSRIARRIQPRTGSPQNKHDATKRNRTPASASKKHTDKCRARRQRRLAHSQPKGFAPDRVPDSERWIPLQQRSYYRPRGRGARQKKARGSAQGGAAEAGSGLGGTGSARIPGANDSASAGASGSPVPSPAPDQAASAAAPSPATTGKPKNAKGKKGKGKGKKASW
ncbi:Srp72p [Coemansia sp. RSA 552]|nr:Srp72p [Coemansia sp. RSA 552]